ncbi:hypothetical protein RIF29_03498 [Crotalaria pallida]|uniref:Uncharacterized protein n=1 Tax=Crotalaria pallida TaxID=3830 RepID=A0AAN9J2G9_CROPI
MKLQKTVRLWQGSDDGSYNCRHILRDHTAEVLTVGALHQADSTALRVGASTWHGELPILARFEIFSTKHKFDSCS